MNSGHSNQVLLQRKNRTEGFRAFGWEIYPDLRAWRRFASYIFWRYTKRKQEGE
jgi:hypothetical protein